MGAKTASIAVIEGQSLQTGIKTTQKPSQWNKTTKCKTKARPQKFPFFRFG